MLVGDIMTTQVQAAEPSSTLVEVARMMADLDVGSIPIVENGQLMGILTDRDIVVRCLAVGRDPVSATAGDLMSGPPVSISLDMDVREAAKLMQDHQVRRLPVVDNGRLVGIVSLADLAVDVGNETLSGETINEISQPGHPSMGEGESSTYH